MRESGAGGGGGVGGGSNMFRLVGSGLRVNEELRRQRVDHYNIQIDAVDALSVQDYPSSVSDVQCQRRLKVNLN